MREITIGDLLDRMRAEGSRAVEIRGAVGDTEIPAVITVSVDTDPPTQVQVPRRLMQTLRTAVEEIVRFRSGPTWRVLGSSAEETQEYAERMDALLLETSEIDAGMLIVLDDLLRIEARPSGLPR